MKKYLLGIIAMVMAVTFSAFTSEKNNLSGGLMQNTSIIIIRMTLLKMTPTHYSQVSTLNCTGTLHRCGVKANDDGTGHPVLSGQQFLQEIENGYYLNKKNIAALGSYILPVFFI